MFDDRFLDAVRNRKFYRVDHPNPEEIDLTWETAIGFLDSHPPKHLTLKQDKISFIMTCLELRGSTPLFVKKIIDELKATFPQNRVTAHFFGGLTSESKSFRIHRDSMDVFYMQILGDIEWSVWEANDPKYYNEDSGKNITPDQAKKLFTERFTCGKMIWIPRGTYHLVEPYNSRIGVSFGIEGEIDPSTYV